MIIFFLQYAQQQYKKQPLVLHIKKKKEKQPQPVLVVGDGRCVCVSKFGLL